MKVNANNVNVMLHPKVRYGTYIISLHELWHYLHTQINRLRIHDDADVPVDDYTRTTDTDMLLRFIVRQNYQTPTSGVRVGVLEGIDKLLALKHYQLEQHDAYAFMSEGFKMFMEIVAAQIPWLAEDTGHTSDMRLRNRYDLHIDVGPAYESRD